MFGSGSGTGTGFGGFGSNAQQNTTNTPSVFGSGGSGFNQGNAGFGNAGGNSFGSTPTTSSFGSPSGAVAFGSNGGFGGNTTSAFGTKPAFGASATTPGSLFSNNGSAAQSTGFGFGQSNTSSSGFGPNVGTSGTGLFGNKGPAFGGNSSTTPSSGLFGNSGSNSGAFGSSSTGGGIGFGGGATQLTAGTSQPPFQPYTEKESGTSNSTNCFQTITFMDAYKNYSFEELRLMDYAQGRRYGTSSGSGAFGFATGFGGTGTNTATSSVFGASTPASGGLFGNNSNAFGQNNTNNNFGTSTSSGLFGAGKSGSSGLFGNNAPTPGTTSGIFGSNTNPPGGAFGGVPPNAGFGSSSGGLFGSNNQNTQNKPGFSFNTTTTPSTGFAGNSSFGSTPGNGGLFGNNQLSQQPSTAFGTNAVANTGGAFPGFGGQGQHASSTFGSTFGQNQQPQQSQQQPQPQQPQQPQQQKSPFGFSTTNSNSGLFGNSTPQQNPTGGLLSKPVLGFSSAAPSTSGMFGNSQSATIGGMFGNAQGNASGSSSFGSAQPNAAAGSGLFANNNPKSTTGIFGSNTTTLNPGASLFNNINPNTQTQTGGLFQQPPRQSTSLFGSVPQQQQPIAFSTSINDSPYGNSQFMSSSVDNGQQNSPLGPIATPLSTSQTKKAAMIPHHKIAPRQATFVPRLSQSFSRSSSPFLSSTSAGLGRSYSSTSKLNLFVGDDSVLSLSAFTPTGNSRVASLKKLVIDKKIRDQDLFESEAYPLDDKPRAPITRGILKKTVTFDVDDGRCIEPETPLATDLGYFRGTPDRRHIEMPLGLKPINDSELALLDSSPDRSAGTYWMVPNAQKLKLMSKESLKKVLGLTIGRRDYGQVRFDNPVDLTGLPCNLEDIPGSLVLFDKRVCTVYPEHMDKPSPGKGMNVPATITLQDCFPVTKNERGKIRDPEHPRFITHIRRLKGIKDTEFVDYLANDGIWIFKVRHFTTYGLESDEDREENTSYAPTDGRLDQKPTVNTVSYMLDESSNASISYMTDSIVEDTFHFKHFPPNTMGSRDLPGSFLRDACSDGGSCDETEDSDIAMSRDNFLAETFAGSIEEAESAEPIFENTSIGDSTAILENSRESLQLMSAADELVVDDDPTVVKNFQLNNTKCLPKSGDWTDQLNNTVSPLKRRLTRREFSSTRMDRMKPIDYGLLDLTRDLYGNPILKKKVVAQRRGHDEIKLMSHFAGDVRNYEKFEYDRLDNAEKQWRKCVRPCWDRDGKIIYRGEMDGLARRKSYKDDGTMYFAKLKSGIQSHAIPKALMLQWKITSIFQDEYGVPLAVLDPNAKFQTFAEIPWTNDPKEQHEKSVWALANVLWDPLDLEKLYEQKERKERLGQFLQNLVKKDAEKHEQASSTLEEVALARLSCHRIEAACAALLESGDIRLASAMTLLGSDNVIRSDLTKQMKHWRNKGILSEVPVPLQALYTLIAGETCFVEGVKGPTEDAMPGFFISDRFGLDWKRMLGLKLWYGCREDEGISRAIELYQRDLCDYPNNMPMPVLETNSEVEDILWGLLKVYSDPEMLFEEVLAPECIGSSQVDYRIPWQLRTLLACHPTRVSSDVSPSFGKGSSRISMPTISFDQLTIEFAGVLEMSGLWEWAVFVVCHLEDADSRETAIKNIIGRYVDDIEIGEGAGGKLDFLQNSLKVPQHWIFEAKALQARSEGAYSQEAEYLLAAKAWNEAHKTIVRQVAPNAIIAGELDGLSNILCKFAEASVDKWMIGGRVYLDYIQLLQAARMEQMKECNIIARRLLGSLKGMETRDFLQRVAIRQMAGMVATWVLKTSEQNDMDEVLKLPLPQDQFVKKSKALGLLHYIARSSKAVTR